MRQNLDSLVHRREVGADTKAVQDVEVLVVDLEVAWVLAVVLLEAAKSMSPTFVPFLFLCELVVGSLLTLTRSFPTL